MSMFGGMPDLESGAVQALREVLALPLWIYFILINGDTLIEIQDDQSVSFHPAEKVEFDLPDPDADGGSRTVHGMVVGDRFVPADGRGSFFTYKFLSTTFMIAFDNLESLTTPAALSVDEDEIASVNEAVEYPVLIAEEGRASRLIRLMLGQPILLLALLIQGRTVIHLAVNRRIQFKAAASIDEPRPGVMVKNEFKDNRGPGTTFHKYGADLHLDIAGMEALLNPAVPEIIRAIEQAEEEGEPVGAGDDEATGVLCRPSTGINVGRLDGMEPFAMMDGTESRKTMNFAYEARAKHDDSSNLVMAGLVLGAFFIGAMSPRLSGTGGGGGGGGGFSIPMPTLLPTDALLSLTSTLSQVPALGVM